MYKLGEKHTAILKELYNFLTPGLDVWDIEEYYKELLKKYGIKSACKGYQPTKKLPPYPTHLCVGVNSQCIHTYPVKGLKLQKNDIVVIDTVVTDGVLFTDSAFTKVLVDKDNLNSLVKKRVRQADVSKQALIKALSMVKPGNTIGMLSYAMYQTIKEVGFDVLYDYGGHGIRYKMWEEPHIPNYGMPGEGPVIRQGMTLAVETLVVSKKPEIEFVDAWATKLKDNGDFAQWEYTIEVTKGGYKIIAGL